MSDELRLSLRRVDGSAPAIQGAAAQLLKHYDRSSATAVNEWRNAVMSASHSDQLLPLLYVANEVLQTSKRNRGNKFLEAFSPVLKQALVYLAHQLNSPGSTEKIRRTVKIWGDRRVFSVRYVNELLQALEPYRNGDQPQQSQQQSKMYTTNDFNTDGGDDNDDDASVEPEFSPVTSPAQEQQQQQKSTTSSNQQDNDSDSHDEIMDILEAHDQDKDSDDDDDDDGLFGDDSERQTLNINIEVDHMTASPHNLSSQSHRARQKRRRSSASAHSHSGNTGGTGGSTTKKALSTTNMLELWNQLQENQAKYELALHTISRIQDTLRQTPADELANLVGDALQHAVRQHHKDLAQFAQQRRLLHELAQERHALQGEAARYLPWLEQQLAQDVHDEQFCQALETKLLQFQPVHAALVTARAQLRVEERERRRCQEERERQERDRQDLERFRQAALAKETEAKPGMVWNPTTREYQSLNTDESWRD